MRVTPVAAIFLASALASCSIGSSAPSATAPARTTGSAASGSAGTPSTPDWPTYHGDARRTGVSTTMPDASGRLRVAAAVDLDGAVYASPIVVGGVTIAATEHDTVYGLDGSGRQLWRVSLGSPAPGSQLPCGNIDPLGITGTPVYDPSTALVFLVAELDDPPRHELVALSPVDGAVAWRTAVDLPGVDPAAMQQRGALTVAAGSVWVPFGGLAGDCGAYKGRLVGVTLDGPHTPTAFTVPTGREGGIWAPPGPSVDATGHLLVSVGNGESGPGDAYDFSDSVLQLAGVTMVDSFSPTSWQDDNANDRDLGSQGPALVGDRWVFIAGKSGTAYVLRQGHLGGIGGQVSAARICPSFGGAAVSGEVVYVPCTDGLRAVRIGADGTMRVLWHADRAVTGSPVVGGGRVWALDPAGGILHAIDPASGRSVAEIEVGVASRFATPAIRGAELVVPTLSGVALVLSS